jgi:predicted porin
MKKTTLSLAIAALLPAFANAEKVEVEMPEFYGKVNVSFQSTNEGDESITEVVSNASRLGVKGKIELNHGLQGIYQAEYQTAVDDGDNSGSTFSQRNIFAGIKGSFGQVKIGMFDTPLKKAQKKVDLFNDYDGDIKSVISASDKRTKNTTQYNTPKMAGLVATVANISSEVDGGKDGLSSSLTFSKDKFYAAAAYDSDVRAEDVNVIRLVAQYSIADITLGALWESEDGDASSENDGWIASAAYKATSDITLKAQYGQSDIVKDEAKTYSLGADYKLAKNAKVFAFVTNEDYDDSGVNVTNDYYAVGTEFKF